MTTPKEKWLVVEVITFSETSESRTLKKVADTFDQALKFKACLEELAKDERTNAQYYLANHRVISERNFDGYIAAACGQLRHEKSSS